MPMASRQMQHQVIPKGREVCASVQGFCVLYGRCVHQYRGPVFLCNIQLVIDRQCWRHGDGSIKVASRHG